MSDKINAAIIGTGNIGTDILLKLQRSKVVSCNYFIGRNANSKGLEIAKKLGVNVSYEGIKTLLDNHEKYDIVFDATSALSHIEHAKELTSLNKKIIDLTPAQIGKFCVPVINIQQILNESNINMITCGGQASIPIAYAISSVHNSVDCIEVVSSISSKSAGPATRINIDEYLTTTEKAIKEFTNCKEAKAILNINPAYPEVNMKTTIMAIINRPNIKKIQTQVDFIVNKVKSYVPGYELIVPPYIENGRVIVMVKVIGAGDFLPSYAGNLDIITSAAVAAAEEIATLLMKR